jgi:hypothetical protein
VRGGVREALTAFDGAMRLTDTELPPEALEACKKVGAVIKKALNQVKEALGTATAALQAEAVGQLSKLAGKALGGGGGGGGAAACGALTALVQPCNDLFADVMKGAAAEMEVSKTLPPRHLSALNHFNFLYHRRVVLYHRSGKTQLKKGSPVTTAKAK